METLNDDASKLDSKNRTRMWKETDNENDVATAIIK